MFCSPIRNIAQQIEFQFFAMKPATLFTRLHRGILRPAMPRIAPAELPADLWIEPFPKSGQIAGHLNRPLIGSEQMHNQRNLSSREAGRLFHPEKILEP